MSTFTLPEFWAGLESCPWSYYKSILLLQKSYLSGYSSVFLFFSSYPLNSPYGESTWNLPGAIMPKSLPPAYPSSDLQTHLPTIYLYQSQTIYLYQTQSTCIITMPPSTYMLRPENWGFSHCLHSLYAIILQALPTLPVSQAQEALSVPSVTTWVKPTIFCLNYCYWDPSIHSNTFSSLCLTYNTDVQ